MPISPTEFADSLTKQIRQRRADIVAAHKWVEWAKSYRLKLRKEARDLKKQKHP